MMTFKDYILLAIILFLYLELHDKNEDYSIKYFNRINVLFEYYNKIIDFIKFIHSENPLLLDYYDEDDDYYKLLNELYNENHDEEKKHEIKEQTEKQKHQEQQEQQDYNKKYLKKYINLTNEYFFTDEELKLKQCKYEELYKKYNDLINFHTDEIIKNEIKICEIKNLISFLEKKYINGEMEKIKNDLDDKENYGEEVYDDYEKLETFLENVCNLSKKNDELLIVLNKNKNKTTEEIETMLMEESTKYIIDNKLNNFINNYVIEYTPIGNVIMRYNHSKGTFEYFSNRTIPYNYLEVIGRKYVTTFRCKSIFINMDEEIEKVNELNEKNKKEQQHKKEEKNNKNLKQNFLDKDGNNLVPDRPNQKIIINPINSINIAVKNSNRYTHEGRFCDFKMNKIINNKDIDKNLKLSFKDFKKLKQ